MAAVNDAFRVLCCILGEVDEAIVKVTFEGCRMTLFAYVALVLVFNVLQSTLYPSLCCIVESRPICRNGLKWLSLNRVHN